jgi:DNA-binding winged helix-turn-helix (wHTH) protein
MMPSMDSDPPPAGTQGEAWMTRTLSLSEPADACRLAAPSASAPAVARAAVEEYHFAGFRLLPYRRLLMKSGERVAIGSRAFALLLKLVENAGTMVSKPDLLRAAWARPHVEESNLRVQICTLKRILSRIADPDGTAGEGIAEMIVSVAGEGYVFTAPVTVRGEPSVDTASAGQAGGLEFTGRAPDPLAAGYLTSGRAHPERQQETRWPVTFSCPYPQSALAFS